MQLALLIPEYVIWHYTDAFRLIANIFSNFIWFTHHFFSVSVLAETLFKPLRGVSKSLTDVSRVLGFFIRVSFIFFAYIVILMIVAVGVAMLFVWALIPIFVIALVLHGFQLLLP